MVLIFFFGGVGVWGEGGRVSLKEHQNTLLIFKIKIRKEFQKVIHMMNFNGFGALINFNCYNTISCIASIYKTVTLQLPSTQVIYSFWLSSR